MLKGRYLERYADVLLWGLKTARRERFRKGNVILIQYDHAAIRLAEILYDHVVAAGMNPIQWIGFTVAMERSFYPDHGKHCASIVGTFCGGEVQGTFARKFGTCRKCPFYRSRHYNRMFRKQSGDQ